MLVGKRETSSIFQAELLLPHFFRIATVLPGI
jgi:hypothetical protein